MLEKFNSLSKGKKILVGFIAFILWPLALAIGGISLLVKGFKSRNFKSLFGGVGLLLLLVFMNSPFLHSNNNNSTQDKETQVSNTETTTSDSKELGIPALATNTLKEGQLLDVIYTEVEEQNPLILKVKLSDNLTNNFMLKGAFMDAEKVMKTIEASYPNSISKYDFWFVADLTDRYGNVEEGKVLSFEYGRETLDKINWDNINSEMLMNLAENSWIHPSLSN